MSTTAPKTVEVHLYSQSEPIVYEKTKNTYTKDGLFCVQVEGDAVYKHPVQHIFRIKEGGGSQK